MSSKRQQEPQWVASPALSLDYHYARAELVGGRGLRHQELHGFLNP